MTKGKHGTGGWGCDGCHEPPWDHTLPGPLDSETLHEWQAYCCACIPSCIIVTMTCGYETSSKPICRYCSEVLFDAILWAGEIPIGEVTHDIAFAFTVENGRCYICLISYSLGVTGNGPADCYEITAAQRAHPTKFCNTLRMDFGYGALPLSWTITGQDCGTVEITIRPDETIPIYPRFSPCYNEYGDLVEDDHPIRDLDCGGCSCICKCACIILLRGDGTADAYTVCMADDGTYWTIDGVRIELQKNYQTGCCQLAVTDTGSLPDSPAELSPVIIGEGNEDNPCPHPRARWYWTAYGPDAEPVGIEWHCAYSDDGCESVHVKECCDGMVSRVLIAEVVGGSDCPCGAILALIYDDDIGTWNGYHPTIFCDGPLRVVVACAGADQWTITVSDNVCTFGSVTVSSPCFPLNLSAAFTVAGVGCCNDFDPFGPTKQVTVTITE